MPPTPDPPPLHPAPVSLAAVGTAAEPLNSAAAVGSLVATDGHPATTFLDQEAHSCATDSAHLLADVAFSTSPPRTSSEAIAPAASARRVTFMTSAVPVASRSLASPAKPLPHSLHVTDSAGSTKCVPMHSHAIRPRDASTPASMSPSSSTDHSHVSKLSIDGTDRSAISAHSASTAASASGEKMASDNSFGTTTEPTHVNAPHRSRSRLGVLSSLLHDRLAKPVPQNKADGALSEPVSPAPTPHVQHWPQVSLPPFDTQMFTRVTFPCPLAPNNADIPSDVSPLQNSIPTMETPTSLSVATVRPISPPNQCHTSSSSGRSGLQPEQGPICSTLFISKAHHAPSPGPHDALPPLKDALSAPDHNPRRRIMSRPSRFAFSRSVSASAAPTPNKSSCTGLPNLPPLGSCVHCGPDDPVIPSTSACAQMPTATPRPSRIPISKPRRLLANLAMSSTVPKAPKYNIKAQQAHQANVTEESRGVSRPKSWASMAGIRSKTADIFRRPSSRLSFQEVSRHGTPAPVPQTSPLGARSDTSNADETPSPVRRDEAKGTSESKNSSDGCRTPPSPLRRPGSSMGSALKSVRRRAMSTPQVLMLSSSMPGPSTFFQESGSPNAFPGHVRRSTTLYDMTEEVPAHPTPVEEDSSETVTDLGASVWIRGTHTKQAHSQGSGQTGVTSRRLSQSVHSMLDLSFRRTPPASVQIHSPHEGSMSPVGSIPQDHASLGPSFIRTGGHRAHSVHHDMGPSPFETAFGQALKPSSATRASFGTSSHPYIRQRTYSDNEVSSNMPGRTGSVDPPFSTRHSYPDDANFHDLHHDCSREQDQRPQSGVHSSSRAQRDCSLLPSKSAAETGVACAKDSCTGQSAPAFHIEDDMEFLSAIETVREHIRASSAQSQKKQTISCLRPEVPMLRRATESHAQPHPSLKTSQDADFGSTRPLTDVGHLVLRRSKSCCGYLGGQYQAHVYDFLKSSSREQLTNVPPADESSRPKSWSHGRMIVGQASGKGRHAAALGNDDDWKKEIKALFVIRELILTERSYGRHLKCLLAAVERVKDAYLLARLGKNAGRKTTVDVQEPAHLAALSHLLPEMIALSQRLVSQIEAVPTAAGVGASFRALSDQVEAKFVGWSFAVADIMNGLRSTEIAPRTKVEARGRIGMIYISRDSSVDSLVRKGVANLACPDVAGACSASPISESAVPGTESLPTSPCLASPGFTCGRSEDDQSRGVGHRKTSSSLGLYPHARRVITAAVRRKDELTPTDSRVRGSYLFSPSSNNSHVVSGLPPSAACRSTHNVDQVTSPTLPSTPSFSPPKKALSPLDIVIMPTQRLPRYLLLLRDLQRNTPEDSLSYLRLDKALLLCRRVTGLCDGASYA